MGEIIWYWVFPEYAINSGSEIIWLSELVTSVSAHMMYID